MKTYDGNMLFIGSMAAKGKYSGKNVVFVIKCLKVGIDKTIGFAS